MNEEEDNNDGTLIDSNRPPLLIDRPTNAEYEYVMKAIAKAGTKLYIPVVSTGLTTAPNVYMEHDDANYYSGIGRIFLTEKGVNHYIKSLAASNGYDLSKFKSYVLSVDGAVKHARSLSENADKPIKFVISHYKSLSSSLDSYEYTMVDLMTFWDGIPN